MSDAAHSVAALARPFPNRFGGKCASCNRRVKAESGFAFKAEGKWRVCCPSTACARSVGVSTEAPAPEPRTLTQHGEALIVRMPYPTPDEFALLRALPGSRYEPETKGRLCSAAPADRPRVLEIASKLRLAVAPELAVVEHSNLVELAVGRARVHGRGYQVTGVEWLALGKRRLLADDMGLGKTFQVLNALPDGARVLVVAPKAVLYVWRDEVARWRPDFRVRVVNHTGAFPVPMPREIVVVNDEALAPSLGAEEPRKGKEPTARQAAEMAKRDSLLATWDGLDVVLVADEAHRYSSSDAHRTRAMRAMSRAAGRCWLLTGTPLVNQPMDLWTVLSAGGMQWEAFGSWERFLDLFGGMKVPVSRSAAVWRFSGPVGPEASERLRRVMLRRMKADVAKDLPKAVFQDIPVQDLPEELVADLDAAWDSWGDDDAQRSALPPIERFSKIRADLATAKIPAMLDVVEQHENAGLPMLVFSAHRAPVETCAARDGWAAIHGDTSAEERANVVRRFQAGELRGVALTIKAGGVGITLTRAANLLFVDEPWNPAALNQATDRAIRIGQTADSVNVYRMVADHPLDKRVRELLEEKAQLIQSAVEDTADESAAPAPRKGAAWVEETEEQRAKRIRKSQRKGPMTLTEIHASVTEHLAAHHGHALLDTLRPELEPVVLAALDYMLGRCDGAQTRDGIGFNAGHAGWVRRLAEMCHVAGEERGVVLRTIHGILCCYPDQLRGGFPELWDAPRDPGPEGDGPKFRKRPASAATMRFRQRAWQWLAPRRRVAKAELLLQLACVAEADAFVETDGEQIEHLETIARMAREGSAFLSGKVALWTKQVPDTPAGRRYAAFDAYVSDVDTYSSDARRALADEIAFHLEPDWGVGNVLVGEAFSVGPYRGATTKGFPFACLDRSGKPMDAMGVPDRRYMNAGGEWTPERAAARFVAHEGLDGARAALHRFLDKHRATMAPAGDPTSSFAAL